MRIFGLNVLTDKQLVAKLETAKTEQRRLNSGIVEKLTCDNVILTHKVVSGKHTRT